MYIVHIINGACKIYFLAVILGSLLLEFLLDFNLRPVHWVNLLVLVICIDFVLFILQ